MKNINPLHLIVLLLVLTVFLYFKLDSAKDELADVKESHQETLHLATQLKDLNNVYADKKRVEKALSIILKQHSLRSAKIEQEQKNNGVVISSNSMNKIALNSLMGKLLNGSYKIHSLSIKRLSDTKVSFKMEIRW